MDGVDEDRSAEHGAVQNGTDGAVGALPHLGQLGIFLHALLVGCNGGTLDSHAQTAGCVGGIYGNLIAGLIAVQKAQIVVLGFQFHKGQDQLVLDHLPQNAGHLIAVHLHQGSCHFNLFHSLSPFYCIRAA